MYICVHLYLCSVFHVYQSGGVCWPEWSWSGHRFSNAFVYVCICAHLHLCVCVFMYLICVLRISEWWSAGQICKVSSEVAWVGPLARPGQPWLVSWSLILLRGHSYIQSGGQNLQSVQRIGLGGNLRIGLGGATGHWPGQARPASGHQG